jgi:hypothetical protein
MPSHTYVATGVVRETGAVLTERIGHCRDAQLALRIAKEWARENALRLVLVERLQPVWVRGRDA